MADNHHIPDKGILMHAREKIKPFIHYTPVLRSETFNKLFGTSLYFKCENFQKAGAFKFRGATNAILSLDKESLRRGVATHSSGNHAQALSLAAANAGIRANIVMPENAPRVKVEAVRSYGGVITFCEPTLEARERTLAGLIARTGAREVHPYNDYRIIAGQATAAIELVESIGDPDLIIAPVGGGGLLSGTILACRYFSPGTRVIGAEPEMANDARKSFVSKEFVPSRNPATIADGLRTSLGSLTFPIILAGASEILTVSETGIIEAMRLIWERMKLVVEPSAAVPLGVVLEHPEVFVGKRVGIILSGGNVDLGHLPF